MINFNMNKSKFLRFGIFITVLRLLIVFSVIAKLIVAMDMNNRLISPIREWFSEVILNSILASIFVLIVSVIESMDYTKINIRHFKKTKLRRQNLKLRSYMMVVALVTIGEAIVVICYCVKLQYTLRTISEEVKTVLNDGLGKYLTNTSWQVFWNQFQQHYDCCGSSQSTDWFQTAWVSPITLSSFTLLKRYTQENGKFIFSAAPMSCCIPNTICNTFIDCELPDPNKYHQNGCFSIIANTINSIASTRYLFYAIMAIQIISGIVKHKGYIMDKNDILKCREQKTINKKHISDQK